jgi:hypothetical protein
MPRVASPRPTFRPPFRPGSNPIPSPAYRGRPFSPCVAPLSAPLSWGLVELVADEASVLHSTSREVCVFACAIIRVWRLTGHELHKCVCVCVCLCVCLCVFLCM